jgi:hypothetical protein
MLDSLLAAIEFLVWTSEALLPETGSNRQPESTEHGSSRRPNQPGISRANNTARKTLPKNS